MVSLFHNVFDKGYVKIVKTEKNAKNYEIVLLTSHFLLTTNLCSLNL